MIFAGPMAGAVKCARLAKALRYTGAAFEGVVGGVRTYDAYQAWQNNDKIAAAGYLGEAVLRMLGMSTHALAALKTKVPTFKSGQLFDTTLRTSQGEVRVLADTVIDRGTLHLKDVVIEPVSGEVLRIGSKEVLAGRQQLIDQARKAGFKTLRITGERVTGANVGKQVDLIIKLLE